MKKKERNDQTIKKKEKKMTNKSDWLKHFLSILANLHQFNLIVKMVFGIKLTQKANYLMVELVEPFGPVQF